MDSTRYVYHYRRPEDVGFVKYLSKTAVYIYFHYRHENDYFHYRRHVNNYFPRRPVNDYFLYIVPNPNRFEGITPRRHRGPNACVV